MDAALILTPAPARFNVGKIGVEGGIGMCYTRHAYDLAGLQNHHETAFGGAGMIIIGLSRLRRAFLVGLTFGMAALWLTSAMAKPVKITFLHTNDVHLYIRTTCIRLISKRVRAVSQN